MNDKNFVDVLIVGAGISGIGSAVHLHTQCPTKSFVVLEAFETFGGTWHMHTYPGIRSDSDLYTFGYRFKPWTGAPIATAAEIMKYMGEVIDEHDLAQHIRYQHKITGASWSSAQNLWTVDVLRTDTNEVVQYTTNFLWMGQGYYKHSQGYTPEWPGMDKYKGRIVHPQTWSNDIDYKDKNVLVIGSGATTATIVPAMAADCKHITVLQRSPTYFWTGRNANDLADTLRQLEINEEWIHEIVRRKVLFDQQAVTKLAFEEPESLKQLLIDNVRALLDPDYDVDKHFTPKYRPWQQRLAFVPDGDLFAGIKSGKASMVTDEIESFTENGVLLKSGTEISADLIITATGFNLSVLGDIPFIVDGKPVDFAQTVTYRGMMFTGVPNMAWVFGYFRASWTLRVDLMGDFICRLLKHMDDLHVATVTPQLRPQDAAMPIGSWMDPENFNPNYLMRSQHLMPKRGNISEWQHNQDYWVEREILPTASLTDGCLTFS
ncbi:MAG: NAD(P)/FAD-dependent oxidoreductase [Actinobacteria bacterium]|nr:MAG: NAD(P)/FAD-dependent oxidoreductase [Actinomycetota bacterium]